MTGQRAVGLLRQIDIQRQQRARCGGGEGVRIEAARRHAQRGQNMRGERLQAGLPRDGKIFSLPVEVEGDRFQCAACPRRHLQRRHF